MKFLSIYVSVFVLACVLEHKTTKYLLVDVEGTQKAASPLLGLCRPVQCRENTDCMPGEQCRRMYQKCCKDTDPV